MAKLKKNTKKETLELILVGLLILAGGIIGIFLMTRTSPTKVETSPDDEQAINTVYRYGKLILDAPWDSSLATFTQYINDSILPSSSIKVKKYLLHRKEEYEKNKQGNPIKLEILGIERRIEPTFVIKAKEYVSNDTYYPLEFILRKEENQFIIENVIAGELTKENR